MAKRLRTPHFAFGYSRCRCRPRGSLVAALCKRTRLVDMTGRRVGRLVALERAVSSRRVAYWLCACDCGNRCVVNGSDLRRGITSSCGCYRAELTSTATLKDLTGQRFGILTVVNRESEIGDGAVRWRCICDCGSVTVKMATNLKTGHTTSCGCLKRRTGPSHPLWDPDLSIEERERRRLLEAPEYRVWRRAVMERDDFTCHCCGKRGGSLCCHHLDGWNWCEEGRYSVDNGVTLCNGAAECHERFHAKFGKGNNTRAQFEQFLKDEKAVHAQAA